LRVHVARGHLLGLFQSKKGLGNRDRVDIPLCSDPFQEISGVDTDDLISRSSRSGGEVSQRVFHKVE
jgi:hypothetical protein